MKRIFLYGITALLVLIIGFVIFICYEFSRAPMGPPDSLIKSDNCTIEKKNNDKYLNDVFTANCRIQEYYIAGCEEDLTKYIGKRVRIEAVYPKDKNNINSSIQTDRQCIAGNCQLLFRDGRKFFAIVVQKIEEIN